MLTKEFFDWRVSRVPSLSDELEPFHFDHANTLPKAVMGVLRERVEADGIGFPYRVETTNRGDILLISTDGVPFIFYVSESQLPNEPYRLLMTSTPEMMGQYSCHRGESTVDITAAREYYLGDWATSENNFVVHVVGE